MDGGDAYTIRNALNATEPHSYKNGADGEFCAMCLFIAMSFKMCLLRLHHVPGAVVGPGDAAVNQSP